MAENAPNKQIYTDRCLCVTMTGTRTTSFVSFILALFRKWPFLRVILNRKDVLCKLVALGVEWTCISKLILHPNPERYVSRQFGWYKGRLFKRGILLLESFAFVLHAIWKKKDPPVLQANCFLPWMHRSQSHKSPKYKSPSTENLFNFKTTYQNIFPPNLSP